MTLNRLSGFSVNLVTIEVGCLGHFMPETVSKLSDVRHVPKNSICCTLQQAACVAICSYRIFNSRAPTWDIVDLFTCWETIYICLFFSFFVLPGLLTFIRNLVTLKLPFNVGGTYLIILLAFAECSIKVIQLLKESLSSSRLFFSIPSCMKATWFIIATPKE